MFFGFLAIRIGFQIVVFVGILKSVKYILYGPVFLVIFFQITVYALFLINIYWTYLLIKGAINLLTKSKKAPNDKKDF